MAVRSCKREWEIYNADGCDVKDIHAGAAESSIGSKNSFHSVANIT